MKGKVDRFVVFKEGSLWHWHLIVSHSPSAIPVAKSGRGYPSRVTALRAIKKARLAAKSAPQEPIIED